MAARTLTPKEIAVKWDTDARTVRKFLRKDARDKALETGTEPETPGKGSRWSLEAKKVNSHRKGFDAWMQAKATKAEEAPESTEGDDDDEVTETA